MLRPFVLVFIGLGYWLALIWQTGVVLVRQWQLDALPPDRPTDVFCARWEALRDAQSRLDAIWRNAADWPH